MLPILNYLIVASTGKIAIAEPMTPSQIADLCEATRDNDGTLSTDDITVLRAIEAAAKQLGDLYPASMGRKIEGLNESIGGGVTYTGEGFPERDIVCACCGSTYCGGNCD